MKKRLAAGSAAVMMLLGANALAATTTIDFQTLIDGVTAPTLLNGSNFNDPAIVIGEEYASLGVIFSSDGDLDPQTRPFWGNFSGFASAGGNIIAQDFAADTAVPGSTFNIRVDFTSGTDMVGADVFGPAGSVMRMDAFDSAGSLLSSQTTTALANAGDSEFLSVSGVGTIAYVIWTSDSSPGSDGVGIDNLTFDSANVPLPGAVALFLSGLGIFGAARRRR